MFDSIHRNPWLTFVLVWAGLTVVAVSWAFATPLAGTPDEPAHLIKAASVAHGQLLGATTDVPGTTTVEVPAGFADAHAWQCFRYQSDVTADCLQPVAEGSGLVPAATSAGLYNPVYYAVVGWPSLLISDTRHAVFMMRIVSATITSLFFAIAFCALLQFRRPLVSGIAFFAAVTPTAFFLAGAVNPNGLEVSAGCALLSLLLVLLRVPQVRYQRLLLVLVAVSGFFLANARGLSPLWMACIAIACLVFAPAERLKALLRLPRVWVTVAMLGGSVALAGLWVLSTNTLSAMGTYRGAGETLPSTAFLKMLIDDSMDPGTIAVFGWLDTVVPDSILYLWSALFIGLVLTAFSLSRGRLLASLLVMLAALFFVPPIAQAMAVTESGYIWQGRYSLVAYAGVILLSGVCVALTAPKLGTVMGRPAVTRGLALLGVLIVTGQALSMLVAIKRYAVGASAEWTTLVSDQVWAPPGGLFLWPAVLIMGMMLVLAVWGIHARPSAPDSSTRAESVPRESAPSESVPVGAAVLANTQYLKTK